MHDPWSTLVVRSVFVAVIVAIGFQTPIAFPQEDDLPPPWELSSRKPGDPHWTPLLQIRAGGADYRDTDWWSAYTQMLAQNEASAGNHAVALATWDSGSAPKDSIGVLPEGIKAVNAVEYLSAVADTAQVMMINERHHAGSDRLLTLELLSVLRKKGYQYFAAETFSHGDSALNSRTYPTKDTGVYIRELVFAEVVREALRLGYILVPYERTMEQDASRDGRSPQQQRDYSQAQNLYQAIFEENPEAKVLIHAGYSHIIERKSERWYPMALYLRELTGIDAVTVDQTRLSERSEEGYEHPAYRAAIASGLLGKSPVILVDSDDRPLLPAKFAVDIQVLTPRTSYTNGRPDWMSLGNRRIPFEVDVPECKDRWCFIEVRAAGDPPEAIPLDWVEANKTENVRLFLPPGVSSTMSVFNQAGEILCEEAVKP